MNEPNEHERVIQLLREARLPAEEITPEHLEENLRWLMDVTLPPARASARLRQRVQALAAAHRAWEQAQQTRRKELRHWPGLEAALREPERELLALLLTADLQQFTADATLRGEARRVMQRLLAELPELLREALLLQLVQGLSLLEIAQVLDCSEGEAMALLQQAKRSIFQQAQNAFGKVPPN